MPIDAALLERIKANDPTLLELKLGSRLRLTNADIQLLAEALTNNTTITSLDLRNNYIIGDMGASAIAQALQHNTALTSLDLGFNKIKATGAKDIALMLQHNTSLTTLYLNSNEIPDRRAQDIALALKHNTTLTTLNIGDNKLQDKSAEKFALMLQHNTTLTTLDLYGNRIGEIGASAIKQALQHNTTLTSLELENNIINDKVLVKTIRQDIEQRRERPITQRRDQFIQKVITLARDASKTDSQSLWSKLPQVLMLHILDFIHFHSRDSIGKSPQQIKACTAFIFNYVEDMKASLAESAKTKQGFKIVETIAQGKSHFRFFPPPQRQSLVKLSEQEESMEKPSKIQKKC